MIVKYRQIGFIFPIFGVKIPKNPWNKTTTQKIVVFHDVFFRDKCLKKKQGEADLVSPPISYENQKESIYVNWLRWTAHQSGRKKHFSQATYRDENHG